MARRAQPSAAALAPASPDALTRCADSIGGGRRRTDDTANQCPAPKVQRPSGASYAEIVTLYHRLGVGLSRMTARPLRDHKDQRDDRDRQNARSDRPAELSPPLATGLSRKSPTGRAKRPRQHQRRPEQQHMADARREIEDREHRQRRAEHQRRRRNIQGPRRRSSRQARCRASARR